MLWKVITALEERAEYTQLGHNHWRAAYRGFVKLSAEGTDPRDAQFNLAEALDALLASLIRAAHRQVETNSDIVVQEEERPAGTNLARRLGPHSAETPLRTRSRRR